MITTRELAARVGVCTKTIINSAKSMPDGMVKKYHKTLWLYEESAVDWFLNKRVTGKRGRKPKKIILKNH